MNKPSEVPEKSSDQTAKPADKELSDRELDKVAGGLQYQLTNVAIKGNSWGSGGTPPSTQGS
jgi:hypothetical protein